MISRWIDSALKFGIEASKDWIIEIPEVERRNMAAFLTASPEASYADWIAYRYG